VSIEKHITVLGALFIGLGILGLFGILAVLMIFGMGSAILGNVAIHEPGLPRQLALLPILFGIFISILIVLTTIPSFVAAYGLLNRRGWAKTMTLVAGILNLLVFPVGTVVGIYAIWVFLQEDTERFLHQTQQ
jgi:hypothetical protein